MLNFGLGGGDPLAGAFNPAAPGPIGGTTPAAITGTTITATTAFIAPYTTTGPSIYNAVGTTTGFGIYDATNVNIWVAGNNILGLSSANGSGFVRTGSGRAYTFSSAADNFSGPDTWITRYAAKQLMISGDGTGATTNAGVNIGYAAASGYSAITNSAIAPSVNNSGILLGASGDIGIQSTVSVAIGTPSATKILQTATAGAGPSITAGTATTDVAAETITRTNNNAAVVRGVVWTFTDTTSAAGFLPFQILGGAGAVTNLLSVSKAGLVNAPAYAVGGTAGANFSGVPVSITVVNGIVTAVS